MANGLAKASLTPFDNNKSSQPNKSGEVIFDFNPETLKIKVETGEAAGRKKRGNQQTQHVGQTKATLSFDATFDNTRPNANNSADNNRERLDIRHKTRPIATFMQAEKNGKNSAAKRLRFLWGTISFDGIITTYDETLDYFSTEGIPLRSKISITLSENNFQYQVKAEQVRQEQAAATQKTGADLSTPQDEPTLPGQQDETETPNFDALRQQVADIIDADRKQAQRLSNELDASPSTLADSPTAGLPNDLSLTPDISPGDLLDVLGDSALGNSFAAGVDLGATTISGAGRTGSNSQSELNTNSQLPDPARPRSEWRSQDGPTAGSKAARIASALSQQRPTDNGNAATAAPTVSSFNSRSTTTHSISLRGSPPTRRVPTTLENDGLFPKRQRFNPATSSPSANRPLWEQLPNNAGQHYDDKQAGEAHCLNKICRYTKSGANEGSYHG